MLPFTFDSDLLFEAPWRVLLLSSVIDIAVASSRGRMLSILKSRPIHQLRQITVSKGNWNQSRTHCFSLKQRITSPRGSSPQHSFVLLCMKVSFGIALLPSYSTSLVPECRNSRKENEDPDWFDPVFARRFCGRSATSLFGQTLQNSAVVVVLLRQCHAKSRVGFQATQSVCTFLFPSPSIFQLGKRQPHGAYRSLLYKDNFAGASKTMLVKSKLLVSPGS